MSEHLPPNHTEERTIAARTDEMEIGWGENSCDSRKLRNIFIWLTGLKHIVLSARRNRRPSQANKVLAVELYRKVSYCKEDLSASLY